MKRVGNRHLTDVWAVLVQGHGRIIAHDFCVAHREANFGLSTLNRTKSILSIYHQQRQLQKQRGMCLNDTYPFCQQPLSGNCHIICFVKPVLWTATRGRPVVRSVVPECVFSRLSLFYNFLPLSLFLNGNIISYGRANGNIFSLGMRKPPFEAEQGTIIKNHEETFSFNVYFSPSFLYGITLL